MDIEINYNPLPWAIPFHTGEWTHACCLGGLGGGKSTASIEELFALALENAGFTYVIARKTLPSLRLSTLKAFLSLLPAGLIKHKSETQLKWTLVNDSEFVFISLDDPEKLKSMEIAGFFVNEANEIDRETYNTLKSRVRQKVLGKPPTRYRTIIDLNPVDEDHWIPQLFMFNRPPDHALYHSTTFDNLDNLPAGYLEMLQNTYTPEEQKRIIYGLCTKVHPGSPVFPEFKTGPYIASLSVDPTLTIIRGWDFGYQHPTCVWMQMRGEQIRVLAEKMGEKIYLDDFVKNVCEPFEAQLLTGIKDAHKIQRMDYCDPRGADKSDKGRTSIEIMNDCGIRPRYRRTSIDEGLKAIRSRLVTVNQEKLPNFLIDPKCTILIEAFRGGYKRLAGEETPHKDGYYDHCFAAGTLIETEIGQLPIEKVTTDHLVKTRSGWRRVVRAWSSGIRETIKISFSTGQTIVCTPEHRFWTENRGWVEADSLRYDDILVMSDKWLKKSFIEELSFGVTQQLNIIGQVASTLIAAFSASIDMFGKWRKGLSQKDPMFITETATNTIISSRILNAFQRRSTLKNIEKSVSHEVSAINIFCDQSVIWRQNGIGLKMAINGIQSTRTVYLVREIDQKLKEFVNTVLQNIQLTNLFPKVVAVDFAQTTVNLSGVVPLVMMMKPENVKFAENNLQSTNIQKQKHVLVNVVGKKSVGQKQVFDITVDQDPEFFANGILVHNCMDGMRYAIIHCLQALKVQKLNAAQSVGYVYTNPHTGRRVESDSVPIKKGWF